MTDYAITDLTEKTTVDGDELIEVVDLKESEEEGQNKKMTIATLMGSIMCYENAVVCYENEVLTG